jgi:primosomal protein N' (replication factor Y)
MQDFQYWLVAVNCPLDIIFTYSATDLCLEDKKKLCRGIKVWIPFGKRKKTEGIIIGPTDKVSGDFAIRSIISLDESYRAFSEVFMKWLEWLADYYIHPIGFVMMNVFPPLDRGVGNLRKRTKKTSPIKIEEYLTPPELTVQQDKVIQDILKYQGFSAHLIFGVTGSGKTEVYMRVLETHLAKGQKGLVIVPEIALTPQLLRRFAQRFGDQVAVIHSHLTPREKTNQWWDIVDGNKSILIGARSALFCPIPNLGIIIVDEEHEASFKQDESLRYHARDAAIMRAQFHNIPILLGSATPSLESWNNTLMGRFVLHQLQNRVENRALPIVDIIDLKTEKIYQKSLKENLPYPRWMSHYLWTEMKKVLEQGKQVALFLNRRGFASVVQCPDCGFVMECPNCDISLTLHGTHDLVCHYCDYHHRRTPLCHNCNEGQWVTLGLGTEQMEQDLKQYFPNYVIARADRDEINSREDMEELITAMENGSINILIGTQMIAKGLDFINLTLVGLVLADVGLHMPDFRSGERAFQIITQMSGRSGRHVKPGEVPGRVIIQTYSPEHPSIMAAIEADFEAFAVQELEIRKELSYPPFGKILSIRISGSDKDKTKTVASLLKRRGEELKSKFSSYREIQILGPSEAPLSRIKNQYRYQVLVKGLKTQVLNRFVRQVLGDSKWIFPQVQITVDVDPINML